MNGKIKWYNSKKGYGFIEGDDGKDVFVHWTSVPKGTFLHDGDSVEFDVEEGEKGPKAINLKKV